MYDVVVVGAGPCGLACTIELAKKGKSVVLIEKGKDYMQRNCEVDEGKKCINCNPCNVISGIGGCVHYGDSVKLSYYPSGRRLYKKLGKDEYDRLLEKACCYWGININQSFYHPDMKSYGELEIKNYPVCVLESNRVKEYIEKMDKTINEMDNIKKVIGKCVKRINKNNNFFEIDLDDKEKICSSKLVLAIGRSGLLWLKDTIDEMGISYNKPKSSVGVRFELPKKYLVGLGNIHPDLKIRTKLNQKKYKTFCFCAGENGGRIKLMNFGEFTLLDGHVLTDKDSNFDRANFALLTKFVKPINYPYDYKQFLEEYLIKYRGLNTIYPGQPICQNFWNFQNRVKEEGRKYDGISSIKELVYGNVFELFDSETLKEFCCVANNIFDYIWNHYVDSNSRTYSDFLREILVVGLEMEGLWDEIITSKAFESTCAGLYFGGDCGGETQGVLQATISGLKIASVL